MAGTSAALEKPVTKPGEMLSRDTLHQALLGAGLGAGAQAALPAISRYLSKGPKLIDDVTKEPTKETIATLEQAFGKDRYTPEELKAFVEKIQPLVKEKGGLSPAVAREGKLAEMDIKGTRSMATGEAPLPAAEEVAKYGAAQAQEKLGAKARELIGKEPGATEIAESLHKGALGAQREVSEAYEGMRKLSGQITPQAEKLIKNTPKGQGELLTNIQEALQVQNLPTTFGKGEGFKKARQAMQWMEKYPISGNYIHDEGLSVRNIEAINQQLNRYYRAARGKPEDQMAISVMKDAFNNTVRKYVGDPNTFKGGDGKAVLKAIDDARDSFAKMKDIYAPSTSSGAGAAEFNRVMDQFAKTASGKVKDNLQQGSLNAAQETVDKYLIDKKVGLAFYDRLQKALGKDSDGMKAVNQQIKTKLLGTDVGPRKIAERIDDFMKESPELAGKVFTTQERYQLKTLSDNLKTIYSSAKPNEQKDNLALRALSHLSSLGLGIIVGSVHGPVAGTAAAAGAEALKSAGRGVARELAKASESRGAPKFQKPLPKYMEGRSPAGVGARSVPLTEDTVIGPKSGKEPTYAEPQPLPPLTIRRATGGRVGGIAAKLMADVERARKEVSGKTKVLLNADDTHIARALEVANRGLEG
jgi:hypothetical protein